jgi:hypothetical protein
MFDDEFIFIPSDIFHFPEPNPLTPDGHATIVDVATDNDSKRFYTFTTPAGNVFYLIIDLERPTDNVYFLNAVTEYDLLALTEESGNRDDYYNDPTPAPIIQIIEPEEPDEEVEESEEILPEPTNNNTGLIIFIVIGAIVAIGAGYYIKIIKPKQQNCMYDDDDEPQDDNEEFMEFEDDDSDDDNDFEEEEHEK